MENKCCENCVYAHRTEEDSFEYLECREQSPTDPESEHLWPAVEPSFWCGDIVYRADGLYYDFFDREI